MKGTLSLGFALLALCLVGLDAPSEVPYAAAFSQYAVAADNPHASAAGAEILAAGGNAADAAAATMLALGVASPASSGLGGGGFALYYDAASGETTFLDFRERAPLAASAGMFDEAPEGEGPASSASQLGGLATGVPGEAAGIAMLVDSFGSLPLARLVEPALRMAREGVPISAVVARYSGYFGAQLRNDPLMRTWFEGGAAALRPGQLLRRETLARTLERFGRLGARAIYRGPIAREIVRRNRELGGILTMRDLSEYRVVTRAPLVGDHLGFRWVTAPPPSAGGFTLLSSLEILSRIPERWRESEDARLHALAESWKGPFLDRQRYFGDPDHVALPLEALSATSRIDARAAAFHPNLAMVPEVYALPLAPDELQIVQPDNAGTSHLCVVDAAGNVASITTTVNLPFGARYTAAGIVMNDEMDDFARAVGEENAFGLVGGAANLPGPGKRMVSTMSPTIVFDDEGAVLCIGAAGGSRIVTATEQVALSTLTHGLDPAEAIRAPRIHHQGMPNTLRSEEFAPLSEALIERLVARGHAHETVHHVAVVQMIRVGRGSEPRLMAVSDPRKGGEPRGR